MRTLVVLGLTVMVASSAYAQPGQTAPQPQPPPTVGYGWQPQRSVMQYQLTVDEQFLLERGYISDGQHIAGGVISLFFGWGIGQAVQGRWSEKGYIFTLGEGASFGLLMWGLIGGIGECFEGCNESRENTYVLMLAGGAIGLVVFRIWEIYDAFAGPAEHNRKLTALRMRLGMPVPMYTRMSPYVLPTRDGDGAVAGVSLRF